MTNDNLYSNVVAECKFIDNTLKNPIFETFFVLLGNNHQQAFFNAYKKRLPLKQVEFFLKECIKNGLVEQSKVVVWMYKTLVAKNISKVFGMETKYEEFVEELQEEMFY